MKSTSRNQNGIIIAMMNALPVAGFVRFAGVAALAILLAGSVPPLSAATIQVGPTRTYTTPSLAKSHVSNGDTVEIDAATYIGDFTTWTQHNLLLRGVGGRPHLNANGPPSNSKATWVIQGTNTTVENIEFSGARLPVDKNGAGIRQEGNGLTVRYCYFHDNDDGILTGAGAASDILMEYCEFANNGYGDGYSHNMYIGNIRSFTLRFCYSHHAYIGHLVKSRANANYILYNRLMDESTGQSSRQIDLPQGGLSYVIGNLIQQGNNAGNSGLVGYALENQDNATQQLYVAHNTMVNQRTAGATFVSVTGPSPTAWIVNNLFVGNGTVLSGAGTLTNNLTWTLAQATQLVDLAGYDYRLKAGSAAIDKGVAPGVFNSHDLTPAFHYVHPAGSEARPVELALDIGAYECPDTDGDGMEDNWERTFFGSLTNTLGAPAADWDGDTVNNRDEYLAGTIPTNPASYLHMTGLGFTAGSPRITWLGGTSSWQYVEWKPDLKATGATWTVVYSNAPAATTSNSVTLSPLTNPAAFFRIRAVRP